MRRTLLLLFALAAAACGGSDDPAPPEQTEAEDPAGTVEEGSLSLPVEDAAAFRDGLLLIAQESAASATDFASYDPYEAWDVAVPDLEVLGREDPATPTGVSAIGSFFKLDDTQPTSADNPWVLSFAVADSAGGCAGGYLAATTDDAPPEIFAPIEPDGDCTAVATFPTADELAV